MPGSIVGDKSIKERDFNRLASTAKLFGATSFGLLSLPPSEAVLMSRLSETELAWVAGSSLCSAEVPQAGGYGSHGERSHRYWSVLITSAEGLCRCISRVPVARRHG